MVVNSLVGLLLIIAGISDIKTRKVSIKLLLLFGAAALANTIFLQRTDVVGMLLGMLLGMIPGIILLLLGKLTRESIGYGDGCLIIIIGIFLGINKTIELMMTALFMAAIYSIFLISFKKAGRKKEMPFVPALFIAFLLMRFAK